ncbi:pre-B-cell leukemia homeobox interacting protein 1b isoform X2 [Cebidichthys violaceus]|uniref:pre-B-cell leukemia homeobox interacting protein 1b isoform X2 n=1 Tax=Cebidichthys violaceus TaxID=271503 RepID=UPI0035CB0239
MSGGSSANNSWTILTPEETVAETLRPLAEGTEHHGDSLTSAAGSGENKPANCAESAEELPVEGHLVSEEGTAELSGDTSTKQHAVTDASAPTSLEVSDSVVAGSDALVQSEGQPEGPALSAPEPDSFSDSYTHISPSSPDEPSASLLSTETLGGAEFTQEEESLTQEGTLHPLNGEELQPEGEGSDLLPKTTDLWKQADSLVGEGTTEETGEDAEPELRRRRSLLAALERIGRTEEEEEGEEEFQLPRQEEDSGFSVNKCILGAVILLGLGTIFFSGVFMDLDEESDYGTMELKDAEAPGKQEWLNPEVPPLPVDADSSELLNKLATGSEQISVLQAQLQEQKEELKVAQLQAEEGAKEQLRWEEMEKENSRLKKEMASLPVLQKENERMKRELECVPALQKELETLRSTVTELKLPSASEAAQAAVKPITSPPSGQPENSMQGSAGSTERQFKKPRDDQWEKRKDVKKDTIEMAEKKERKERDKSEWKEGEKRERQDGGKTEWKQGKHEQGKFDKEKDKDVKQKRHGDETKQWREKEGKKEKAIQGDEGKQWKDKEGKKEWIEKSGRKERKEEKDWKKASRENGKEGIQWRGKEEKKDWKVGKDRGEKHKSKEEWKGEKEWKKGKDGFEGSGKEKWEKKDWKEKGEKKEGDWKSKDGKDRSKEGKGKGERKQWEESKNHGKERKGKNERNERKSKDDDKWRKKDERKQWEKKEESWKSGEQRDKKHNGDWKKDKSSSQNRKDEHKSKVDHAHKEEHLWGDGKLPHTHSRPSLEQPEYWVQQRQRLQHNPKPPQQCDSLETCAQTEGLLPVPFPEFEAILLTYLAKAEEAGVDLSKREELKKLAAEFFRDGVFVHDQTSFQEFVEDLGDILEDMVEGDDDDDDDEEEEEDSAIEEEMEEFEREVMKKFSVPGAVAKEERSKAEWRKESGRGRG